MQTAQRSMQALHILLRENKTKNVELNLQQQIQQHVMNVSEINKALTEVKNTCCYGESQKTKTNIKHINKPATQIYLR